MASDTLSIELLPEERALLLEWTYPFEDLASQLSSFRASEGIETVTISPYFLRLLLGLESRDREARVSRCGSDRTQ